MPVLDQEILGNTLFSYLLALAILLFGGFLVWLVTGLFLRHLKNRSDKPSKIPASLLEKVWRRYCVPLLYLEVLYLAIRQLDLQGTFFQLVEDVEFALLLFFSVSIGLAIITCLLQAYWMKGTYGTAKERTVKGVLTILQVLVWVLAVVFLLDNLGFKITAIIAGLGIGGVAIALATQAILSDLFSYFAILFDRPFEMGDLVAVGDCTGTIEHIGIKTTRIRSAGGEQIIFANSDLTHSRLRNYKQMECRRVIATLAVPYDTTQDQLEALPAQLREAINHVDQALFERAHFLSFGDSALQFEVAFLIKNPDSLAYREVQHQVNLAIKAVFERQGIAFAYPTQTIYWGNRGNLPMPPSV